MTPTRLDIDLPADREAPGLARRAVERHVRGRVEEPEERTLVLLVSELVTNAIRHAGYGQADGTVRLVVSASGRRVRVEVHDKGPGFRPGEPRPRPAGDGGFGLVLVERMSDRWGVRGAGGSQVWFELDRRRA